MRSAARLELTHKAMHGAYCELLVLREGCLQQPETYRDEHYDLAQFIHPDVGDFVKIRG